MTSCIFLKEMKNKIEIKKKLGDLNVLWDKANLARNPGKLGKIGTLCMEILFQKPRMVGVYCMDIFQKPYEF